MRTYGEQLKPWAGVTAGVKTGVGLGVAASITYVQPSCGDQEIWFPCCTYEIKTTKC